MLELSQVILGVTDLAGAAARLRALGLEVLEGGVHPGVGTANRIVPLGRQYLELLGVVDFEAARQNAYGRALLASVAGGDRLVRWSLRTDAIEEIAARLGLEVERRQRVRPDGRRLKWRAAGLSLALEQAWLPFFMQWENANDYPGALRAAHPCGATEVAWIEVCAGDADQLARWIDGADAPVRVCEGTPGLLRVGLRGAGGQTLLALGQPEAAA